MKLVISKKIILLFINSAITFRRPEAAKFIYQSWRFKDYQKNHRPLLGDGVQEFAPNVGFGMLDSTICDIYLVNDAGKL